MIGIVHGYGLSGSGSNLWTREVVRAACSDGETVHLLCQEADPARFDFVSTAYRYDDGGAAALMFERETSFPGRCTVHLPKLKIPTYVRPRKPSKTVASILDLDESALEDYIVRNVRVLRRVVEEYGIRAVHVNHIILASVAALRVREETGLGVAVMPHGSAIVYVVDRDDRMKLVAADVLRRCDVIFTLNEEIRDRIRQRFAELSGLEGKMIMLRVGVDTSRFRVVPRGERGDSVAQLAATLKETHRGKTPELSARLREGLHPGLGREEFLALTNATSDYAANQPDVDVETKLAGVPWPERDTVVFVGRLIWAKGLPTLLAALPLVARRRPALTLLVAGSGSLREPAEAFLWALEHGEVDLADRVIRWGMALEGEKDAPPHVTRFLQGLRETGELEAYSAAARSWLGQRPAPVLFTGFLEHDALCHVFPLGDVGVFPSLVAEASPLVIPEAAASGSFPMGTDFAGMRRSLDALAPLIPPELEPATRIRPDPEHTVRDIAGNLLTVFDADVPREALRAAAVERYDWHTIARTLRDGLDSIGRAADDD